jgi:hypothetical protein
MVSMWMGGFFVERRNPDPKGRCARETWRDVKVTFLMCNANNVLI